MPIAGSIGERGYFSRKLLGLDLQFAVPMIADFEPGVYGKLWQVVLGNQPVCELYTYIAVQ